MSSIVLILLSGFNLLLLAPLWVLKRDILKIEVVFHSILFVFALSFLFFGYLEPFFIFALVVIFKLFLNYFFDYFRLNKFSLDVLVVAFISSFYALGVALLNYLINVGVLSFDFTKLILIGNPVYYDVSLVNNFIFINLIILIVLFFILSRYFSAYFFNLHYSRFVYNIISILVVFMSVYVLGFVPTLAFSACSFFILQKLSFKSFLIVNLFGFLVSALVSYLLYISTSLFLFGPTLVVFYMIILLMKKFNVI